MVWVTGACGLLGSELSLLLMQNGIPFVATGHEVDIADPHAIDLFVAQIHTAKGERRDRISWIVNCAAYTEVDRAEEEPEEAYSTNTDGPANLARVAAREGSVLIHLSTDYVFDGTKGFPYTEADEPHPLSVYGKSKYEGENRIREILPQHLIFRTSWLYGRKSRGFVWKVSRAAAEGRAFAAPSDRIGSPTWAKSLAEAIVSVIVKGTGSALPYGIWHCACQGAVSRYELAQEIERIMIERGKAAVPSDHALSGATRIREADSSAFEEKAMRPSNSSLDSHAFCSAFSIRLPSIQEALVQYMQTL